MSVEWFPTVGEREKGVAVLGRGQLFFFEECISMTALSNAQVRSGSRQLKKGRKELQCWDMGSCFFWKNVSV